VALKPIPALVVAGLRSGVGKTTVTLGLIRALTDRGLKVAAYKIGPDFLDPSHYQNAGAVYARNLDPILQSSRGMNDLFHGSGPVDARIIEGVMGLFDGPIPGKATGSTADIAGRFGLPVLLVCDTRSCAQSISAEIVGARTLLRDVPIAAVALNFVGSPRHAELLARGVRSMAGIRVAGCLFRDALPAMPSRHLGLVPAAEFHAQDGVYARCGKAISGAFDLNRLLRDAARAAPVEKISARPSHARAIDSVRRSLTVAIAMDEAFSFYYPETLDYFRARCAQMIEFSPLKDRVAPDADLYYFGGGFPEVYAARLSGNQRFREDLRRRIADGAHVYAECGGLMYLSREIETTDGVSHPMAGALPGRCRMHARRQALGYWKARVLRNTEFLRKNLVLIGHEYHWSTYEPGKAARPVYESRKIGARDRQAAGWLAGTVFASYLHLSPHGNSEFFRRLVEWGSARMVKRRR